MCAAAERGDGCGMVMVMNKGGELSGLLPPNFLPSINLNLNCLHMTQLSQCLLMACHFHTRQLYVRLRPSLSSPPAVPSVLLALQSLETCHCFCTCVRMCWHFHTCSPWFLLLFTFSHPLLSTARGHDRPYIMITTKENTVNPPSTASGKMIRLRWDWNRKPPLS